MSQTKPLFTFLLLGGLALSACAPEPAGSDSAPEANCNKRYEAACDGTCVSLSDIYHCGSCDNQCSPYQRCVEGACSPSCSQGQLVCRDNTQQTICVDPAVDVNHCGACDNACASDQACMDGACVSTTSG